MNKSDKLLPEPKQRIRFTALDIYSRTLHCLQEELPVSILMRKANITHGDYTAFLRGLVYMGWVTVRENKKSKFKPNGRNQKFYKITHEGIAVSNKLDEVLGIFRPLFEKSKGDRK